MRRSRSVTFLAAGPDRLVIDIDGLELSPQLRDLVGKVRPDDPFIAGVRVGQSQPRTVRLVIDLKQATAPQLFTLAPVAAYQNRLVFDLYPTHEPDPLLALIRDKDHAERQAAQSVQDALGEFIDRIPPGTGAAASTSLPRPRAVTPASVAVPAVPPPAVAAGSPLPPTLRRRAGSTGWSSSPSTPATAAKTRAPAGRAACTRKTWCWRSPCNCATASTACPTCAP